MTTKPTVLSDKAIDHRLAAISPEFQEIIVEAGKRFARYGAARGGRAFHLSATTLVGELVAAPATGLPAHRLFTAGARYRVLLRHANGAQDDDAACDNRGASLRMLDLAKPDQLDQPVLDLLLTTGECFMQATAAGFLRWLSVKPDERAAWAVEQPHIGEAAWDMLRHAESFTELHYHSKVASRFVGVDGRALYARFRLVPGSGAVDRGHASRNGERLPPNLMPRAVDDRRTKSFLHDELRQRVDAGGVSYRLLIQLRAAATQEEVEAALDCTRRWPETDYPLLALANLHFNELVDEATANALAFNPGHAPDDLALPLAKTPHSTASLNHLRSVVYDIAAAARGAAMLPTGLDPSLFTSPTPVASATRVDAKHQASSPATGPRRICVIGAGVSGLTAARTLEKIGHRVTVLDSAETVGGKCGSVEIAGHWYDLGGHFCSSNYRYLGRLVKELNIPIEETAPGRPYDLERNLTHSEVDPKSLGAHWMRYIQLRDRSFPDLVRPGLGSVDRILAEPVLPWLRRNELSGFSPALEIVYTSSGYGYFTDPDLSALYFLKSAETVLGASPGSSSLPNTWTVKGGFLRLWRQVASELADVRLGVDVRRVERGPGGVRIFTNDGVIEADALVVATPLHQVPPYLDATDEERDIFGRVRYLDYYTVAASVRGLPKNGSYLLTPNCTDANLIGHPVAFHQCYPDQDVYLWYANGRPGDDVETILTRMRQDAVRMGGEITAVHNSWHWAYFPHFGAADVADGIHGRLEALQGRNSCYFLGSLFNFELIECNVAYATELMTRHFGTARAEGDAPVGRSMALLAQVQRILQEKLELSAPPHANAALRELGVDSLRAVSLLRRLSTEFGTPLNPTIFYECSTVATLADHLAGLGVAARQTSGPAGVALAQRAQRLLQKELGLQDAPLLTTKFMDLGVDSLRAVALLRAFSIEFGQALAPAMFFEYPTVGALVAFLEARAGTTAAPRLEDVIHSGREPLEPLVAVAEKLVEAASLLAQELAKRSPATPQLAVPTTTWFRAARRPPKMRLFCFHQAGGSAANFTDWTPRLPAEVDLRLLQLPGRPPRQTEPPTASMATLLEAVEREIASLSELPFAFFGHSMGAIMAFETARRLRRVRRPMPFHLFLSAAALPEEEGPIVDPLKRFKATPSAILSPLTGADLQLFQGLVHVVEPPLDVPITALGGRDDDFVSGPELDSWALETRASFERIMFDGGHDYGNDARDALLALIVRVLNEGVPGALNG